MSASRRLEENGDNPDKLLKINKEMISDARLEGHDLKNGHQLTDLELLAELQHYGAATCLIDFTYSAQIALWMACRQRSKWNVNGKVFAVRSNDPVRFKKVIPESLQENLDYFFKTDERRGYPLLYQWQPKQQNNRIIAQQSIFLFGGDRIQAEAECVILKNNKEAILTSLEKSSGITEKRMFPDFDGFARLRAHDRPYVEPDVQYYLQLGTDAHQEGRFDDAIVYYNEVISLQPDNLILANAHYNRAMAYLNSYSDAFDLYIEDLGMAIQLNPLYAEAYKDRGFAYLFDKGEAKLAIEDFSKSIQLKPNDAEAYCFRGISWLFLRSWEKAETDLATAQKKEFDIAEFFYDLYGTAEQFKEHTEIELPKDIAAILTLE